MHMLVNDDNEQMFQVRDQNVTFSLNKQTCRLHDSSEEVCGSPEFIVELSGES